MASVKFYLHASFMVAHCEFAIPSALRGPKFGVVHVCNIILSTVFHCYYKLLQDLVKKCKLYFFDEVSDHAVSNQLITDTV